MDIQSVSALNRITFDAKNGPLYKLWVVNLLLNIITLGIYSFWGKTRIRRYVVSSLSLSNDRFEFTGSGKEIFMAFIKATVFLVLISLPLIWAVYDLNQVNSEHPKLIEQIAQDTKDAEQIKNMEEEQLTESDAQKYEALQLRLKENGNKLFEYTVRDHLPAFILAILYYLFLIAYLPFVAKYGVLHYLTGHIKWRGIRSNLVGSPFKYGFYGFLHMLLTVVTLGLWLPVAQMKLMKYKQNRLYFGSEKGTYISGKMGKLFLSHILTLLLLIPTLGLSRFWYRARLARYHMECFTLGPLQFKSTVTGGKLLKLKLLNLLILVFTLGIGFPIVLKRNLKFFAENIEIIGDLEAFQAQQSLSAAPKTGEGISHWLDVGANFKSGYLILNF